MFSKIIEEVRGKLLLDGHFWIFMFPRIIHFISFFGKVLWEGCDIRGQNYEPSDLPTIEYLLYFGPYEWMQCRRRKMIHCSII